MLIFLFVSCSDYLEEEVFSSSQTSNFYQNEQQGISALNGVYAALRETYFSYRNDYQFAQMLEGPTGTVVQNGLYNDMNYSDTQLKNIGETWDRMWVCVNRASTLIRLLKVENIEESSVKRILAEAKFLRAVCYFNLVRMWGQVPIMNGVTSLEEGYPVKSSESDVYKFIIEDLKSAAQDLPKWNEYSSLGQPSASGTLLNNYQNYEPGRATKGAAQGILAKVYLTIASSINSNANRFDNAFDMNEMYTNAKMMCEEVYNGGHGYGLIDNYFDVFQEENENGMEDIFSINFTEGTDVKVGNSLASVTGIRRAGILSEEKQTMRAEPSFLEEFDDADERKEATFVLRYYDKNENLLTFENRDYRILPYKKYWSDYQLSPDNIPMVRTTYQWNTSPLVTGHFGDDIPVLRYSDLLLMYAEALHALGDDALALERVADVRERANLGRIMPPGDVLELIISERRRELCFENQLWFDYLRLNLTPRYRPDLADSKYKYFPIPVADLMSYPGLRPQNPGW